MRVGPFGPAHLRVHAVEGREAVNELYRFDVVVTTTLPDLVFERAVLGRAAALGLRAQGQKRAIHGVVAAVGHAGHLVPTAERRHAYRLRLVPRAELLRFRRGSRIFQDRRVEDVIAEVARAAGVRVRFDLAEAYPPRPYCTQYEESDLDFVCRLAAENGLLSCFEQPDSLDGLGLSDALDTALRLTEALAPAEVADLLGGAAAALGVEETWLFTNAARYAPIGAGPATGLLASAANAALGAASAALGSAASAGLGAAAGALGSAVGGEAAGALGSAASAAVGAAAGALAATIDAHGPAPAVPYRATAALGDEDAEYVEAFELRRALRPTAAVYREYDPERPLAELQADMAIAPRREPAGLGDLAGALRAGFELALGAGGVHLDPGGFEEAVDALVEPRDLEVYQHHGRDLFPDWEHRKHEPERMLRAERRRTRVGHGTGRALRFEAGRRFVLEEHPVAALDAEYAIVAVEHRGTASFGGEGGADSYHNRFEVVPARVAYVPAPPRRRSVQVCLTARVVGPDGEDIHVNERGEIRVRFHWDRREPAEADPTCWIRCMQPWAGAGWGHQFIPRIGMEVVVVFEGGDPDKPLVLGSVYNGVMPWPFALPRDKTRSGIRTHSTPHKAGYNELSFEDAAEREQILLRAERDFDTRVERRRTARVGEEDHTEVVADQHLHVHASQFVEVGQQRELVVRGDEQTTVHGRALTRVHGDADASVGGASRSAVRGDEARRVEGNSHLAVQGALAADVEGGASLLVGRADARQSLSARVEGVTHLSSTGSVGLQSESEILLRSGDSFVRVAPGGVEIVASRITLRAEDARLLLAQGEAKLKTTSNIQLVSDDKIVLQASGAALGLQSQAQLQGSQVLLNSPAQASDDAQADAPEPCHIELVDQDGNPVPHRRFRIRLGDGTDYTGYLDADGKAEAYIEGSGELDFPELAEVEEG